MYEALRITCTDLPSASVERMNLHHLTSLFQVFCLFVCSFLFLHPKIKMSYNFSSQKKKKKKEQGTIMLWKIPTEEMALLERVPPKAQELVLGYSPVKGFQGLPEMYPAQLRKPIYQLL